MLFLIRGVDRPDHRDVRAGARNRHLEYVASFGERVLLGGPTLDPSGEEMTGSMFIVDLPDRDAAQAFVDGDPYVEADLFESVTLDRWRQGIGRPLVP